MGRERNVGPEPVERWRNEWRLSGSSATRPNGRMWGAKRSFRLRRLWTPLLERLCLWSTRHAGLECQEPCGESGLGSSSQSPFVLMENCCSPRDCSWGYRQFQMLPKIPPLLPTGGSSLQANPCGRIRHQADSRDGTSIIVVSDLHPKCGSIQMQAHKSGTRTW